MRIFGNVMLNFTGAQPFVVGIKLYAEKMGYSLSTHGLARNCIVKHDGHGAICTVCDTNKIVTAKNEKEIFDFLGLKYKGP